VYVIAKVGNHLFINFLSNNENELRKREIKDPYFHQLFYTIRKISYLKHRMRGDHSTV
jgi:hypothetical protein